MADDKLPCCRSPSIVATNSDSVRFRSPAMAFKLPQNLSSRLTLVLCPPMTTERFKTADFIRLASFSFNDLHETCRNIWGPFLLGPGRKGRRPSLHSILPSHPTRSHPTARERDDWPLRKLAYEATCDQDPPALWGRAEFLKQTTCAD